MKKIIGILIVLIGMVSCEEKLPSNISGARWNPVSGNSFCNLAMHVFTCSRLSFSQKVKQGFKSAIKFIDDFEETAVQVAIEKKYDYVVCGHIHHPIIKHFPTNYGTITYLNSGDWVENLTALEYNNGNWSLYHHIVEPETEQELLEQKEEELTENAMLNMDELLKNIVK